MREGMVMLKYKTKQCLNIFDVTLLRLQSNDRRKFSLYLRS